MKKLEIEIYVGPTCLWLITIDDPIKARIMMDNKKLMKGQIIQSITDEIHKHREEDKMTEKDYKIEAILDHERSRLDIPDEKRTLKDSLSIFTLNLIVDGQRVMSL